MQNVDRLRERFWAKVDESKGPDACWPWLANRLPKGYGLIRVKVAGRWINGYAHRVSWFLHHGKIASDHHIMHICDNPECVNPKHLFSGTAKDNMYDAMRKQRVPHLSKGETNGYAKLDEYSVIAIRSLKGKESQPVTAKRFNVSQPTISLIQSHKLWSHI